MVLVQQKYDLSEILCNVLYLQILIFEADNINALNADVCATCDSQETYSVLLPSQMREGPRTSKLAGAHLLASD